MADNRLLLIFCISLTYSFMIYTANVGTFKKVQK